MPCDPSPLCDRVPRSDMFPTTSMGKLVATFAMVCGLLVLALPISIIGTNFLVCYQKADKRKRRQKAKEEAEVRAREEEREEIEQVEKQELKRKIEAIKLAGTVPWLSKRLHPEMGIQRLPRSMSLRVITAFSGSTSDPDPSTSLSKRMKRRSKFPTSSNDLQEGHHSLVGLKAHARLTPSFLFDASNAVFVAVQPQALTGISAIDRRQRLLHHSASGFTSGLFAKRESHAALKMDGVAEQKDDAPRLGGLTEAELSAKYAPLLEAAQALLECVQVFARPTPLQHISADGISPSPPARTPFVAAKALRARGKLDDPTVLNVSREVQDLVKGVLVLKEREGAPVRLIGAQVDTFLSVILTWLGRNVDESLQSSAGNGTPDDGDDGGNVALDPEDERALRLAAVAVAVAAIDMAKLPARPPVSSPAR